MAKEPWQAAELLDEIAKRADHLDILRGSYAKKLANVRPNQQQRCTYSFDPVGHLITITYLFKASLVMEGVTGSTQDVVDWMRTGLKENQRFELREMQDGEYFALISFIKDEQLYGDFVELSEKMLRILAGSPKN